MNTGFAEPEVAEIGDGVLAVVQYDGGWCLSNAGVITGPARTVVVDTMATERRSRRLREIVDRAAEAAATRTTEEGPALAVVNTHHHGDHTFGNAAFAPEATIIAHERTATAMAELGLALLAVWPRADWGDIELTLPTTTYRDAYRFGDDDTRTDDTRTIEVLHVGPAHTPDDSVVHLPDDGILFVGDVVLGGATPFCLMGSVTGSLRAIDRLRALGAETVVPGHGPVGGPELFDVAEEYLHWLQDLAKSGRERELDPLALARTTDLGRFADLRETERLVGNLARVYAELDGAPEGTPLDVPRIFGEMAEYHGGMPPCHA
ncbi:beta-lactamase domain protein [Catenulispora acidiphila DSM 44928]|uniref:Beta-lactamase domain protein n=1 Tax=Catenulispora acidiphila (strain DSM 44928 / JCM 14897 / NBRC 102108 / NRRL B-24433 / ID139908) TaxID=479433 RepID=C7PY59_CATAD|nr:MBL fold metallo-hydrolase [Catenulispora acidiphila]ACU75349.1 beta-lactamase domain protein [Catenulispora acidiphila DSM 44928]